MLRGARLRTLRDPRSRTAPGSLHGPRAMRVPYLAQGLMGSPSPPAPRGRRALPGPSGGLGHGRPGAHIAALPAGKRRFRAGPLPPPGVPQPRMRTLPPPGKGKRARPRVPTSRRSYARVPPEPRASPQPRQRPWRRHGRGRTLPTPPFPVRGGRARSPAPAPAAPTAPPCRAPRDRSDTDTAAVTDTAADIDNAAVTDTAADTDTATAAAAQAGS